MKSITIYTVTANGSWCDLKAEFRRESKLNAFVKKIRKIHEGQLWQEYLRTKPVYKKRLTWCIEVDVYPDKRSFNRWLKRNSREKTTQTVC